jgi:hypothetical protein
MRIITPSEIQQVAWEGTLAPLGAAFKDPVPLPRVTIGEPAFWSAEQALEGETGKKWSPPANGDRYTLVRLACTLHAPDSARTRYAEATLTADLRPRQGARLIIAHDLYPQRLTAEDKASYTVKLGPELKFADLLDAKLLEVGAEIEYHKVFPVIQGFGLGERRPYWRFAHHSANPLLGSQSVYLVVAAPRDAGDVQIGIELVATLETRYGPIRVGLPEQAQAQVSRTIKGAFSAGDAG